MGGILRARGFAAGERREDLHRYAQSGTRAGRRAEAARAGSGPGRQHAGRIHALRQRGSSTLARRGEAGQDQPRMKRWLVVALVLCFSSAAAQDYPARSVRVIVPFEAGGALDAIARIITPRLSEAWGQQVMVENRAGAGGNIGAQAAARSIP